MSILQFSAYYANVAFQIFFVSLMSIAFFLIVKEIYIIRINPFLSKRSLKKKKRLEYLFFINFVMLWLTIALSIIWWFSTGCCPRAPQGVKTTLMIDFIGIGLFFAIEFVLISIYVIKNSIHNIKIKNKI